MRESVARTFSAVVKAKAGYVYADVEENVLDSALAFLRGELGATLYAEAEQTRASRPSGAGYHITLFSPKEFRTLRKTHGQIELPAEALNFELKGVGTARNEESQVWFGVVSSVDAAAVRASYGLEAKDFHITLGIIGKDIFDVPKDESTLL